MRANSSPAGMPTPIAAASPVRNRVAESRNWTQSSPDARSSHSRTSVAESGTMKAALVLRPTISHSAMPASRLSQNGACRRAPDAADLLPVSPVLTPTLAALLLHHRVGVAPDRRIDQPLEFHRLLAGHDAAGADRDLDHVLDRLAVHAVVIGGPEPDIEELLEGELGDRLVVT